MQLLFFELPTLGVNVSPDMLAAPVPACAGKQ